MEPPPHNTRTKQFEEAFYALLLRLDSDREHAGKKYEDLRRDLIMFFRRHGCVTPEELTDETLDRAARRISEGVKVDVEPAKYFKGIAWKILQEYFRKSRLVFDPPPPREPNEIAVEAECMRKCLKLHPESRELLTEYLPADYQARLKIAKLMGLSIDGLRSKVHRMREELRKCLRKCIERSDQSKIA